MSVDLAQYRVTVAIFNNRKTNEKLKLEDFPIWKWSNNFFKYDSTCSSLRIYINFCALFLSKGSVLEFTIKLCILFFLLFNFFQIVLARLFSLLVMLRRDVEVNPGTKRKSKTGRLFLNSISTYNYCKLFFLNSCNSLHKFDIICLSETYRNSETSYDDNSLEMPGYNIIRDDYSSNTEHGGVCV